MIEGVEFSGIAAGVKPGGLDLGLAVFQEEMNAIAIYTRNRVKAAHIIYDRRIDKEPVRALLVNSGCANACTGKEGLRDIEAIASALSPLLKTDPRKILFASTGVIGRRLPLEAILSALPHSVKEKKGSGLENFARAIMTTDTYPKIVQEGFTGKKEYNIVGVAKGSGMINPLFATMLAFVFTDFPVSPGTIRRTFTQSVRGSFERITVDGECSTNDTVMLFTKRGREDGDALEAFSEGLRFVLKELAMLVVRDGEGATRVAHIMVTGAKKKEWAEKIARRISVSPLTKTAFFGCDPNWGRIMAAAGDAGVPLNPAKVEIALQGETIVKAGVEVPFDEAGLKKLMNRKDISVVVNLNEGKAFFDIYTTDLTYDYVKINASYRS